MIMLKTNKTDMQQCEKILKKVTKNKQKLDNNWTSLIT